jgi:hypothetical protein
MDIGVDALRAIVSIMVGLVVALKIVLPVRGPGGKQGAERGRAHGGSGYEPLISAPPSTPADGSLSSGRVVDRQWLRLHRQ